MKFGIGKKKMAADILTQVSPGRGQGRALLLSCTGEVEPVAEHPSLSLSSYVDETLCHLQHTRCSHSYSHLPLISVLG